MKKLNPGWIAIVSLVGWGLVLLALALPSLGQGGASLSFVVPIMLMALVPLTIAALFVLIRGLVDLDAKKEHYTYSPTAKILAVILATALLVGTFTAIRSVWLSPEQGKFIYQNITTALGYTSFVTIGLLSALQRDIYWATRDKDAGLDERQLHDRQTVFIVSYKLMAKIVVLIVILLGLFGGSLATIVQNNFNSVPGILLWLPINLLLTIYALPLIIAAWQRR